MWTPTKLLRPILWQVILVDSMLDKVEVVPNPASRSDDRDAEAAAVRVLTRFPHDAVLHTRTSSVQTNFVRGRVLHQRLFRDGFVLARGFALLSQ